MVLGIPEMLVRNETPHFKGETPELLATNLGVLHRLLSTHSSRSIGNEDLMNLETGWTIRVFMSERGRAL